MKVNIFIVLILCFYWTCVFCNPVSNPRTKLRLINESQECADDIRRLCGNVKGRDDIILLNCLQDNEEVMKAISTKCQHFLWSYKRNFTTSEYLEHIISEECDKKFINIKECNKQQPGYRVPCLIDQKGKVTDEKCHDFLNSVGIIIFSDYHLIYKFVDNCENDIVKSKCGRINRNSGTLKSENGEEETESQVSLADYITTQADTIDCLINSIVNVSKQCQHEILRVSELQSDDYHLNRKLYMACREDRDNLCATVHSGEGRVYACLMKNKFSDKMSKACRKQLTRKQKIESIDVKADYPLFSSCKADIEKYECMLKNVPKDEALHMSTLLLCLEDAEAGGGRIDPNCKAELNQKRVEMLEDFRISPEVVVACMDDVKTYCDQTDRQPGAMLQCLMGLATPDQDHPKGRIISQCRIALTHLLKMVNPTEDVMLLDPAIRRSCSSSLSTLCENVSTKDQAFQCLVLNIDSSDMAPDCRGNLTSLLYFISYDFTIDFSVRRACYNDVSKLCQDPKTKTQVEKQTEKNKKMEYFCMYNEYKKDKIQRDISRAQGVPESQIPRSLSVECSNEIFKLIKAQASQIELDPLVYDSCLEDLATHCRDSKHKRREHECLQDHFDNLKPDCKKAIIDFSKMGDADIRLNRQINEACTRMSELFCAKENPSELFNCLVLHKRHPDMVKECQAAIEHIQLISLEEYRIDHRFVKFCEKEIGSYCSEELKINSKDGEDKIISKVNIVSCLSKTVVQKLVNGESHPLGKMCRRQFAFELLQRSDSVSLDQNLLRDCKKDILKYCSKSKPDQVSTCLREHQDELEDSCHRRIFRRERLEALDANFDGRLRRVCSQMIDEHCHDVPGSKLFQCLHKRFNEPEFDDECRQLIFLRLERRMNDIRLNPGLLNDCKKDIIKYCKKERIETLEPTSGIEFEGKIINCLKEAFSNQSQSMQPSCRRRIFQIIVEANAHLRLDPVLQRKCMPVIKEHCNNEFINHFDMSLGSVHDCLKHKFLLKKIDLPECADEIYRLLKEGRADVHVDSQLFNACEDAIMKLCRSENFGDGRKMSCLLYLAEDKKGSSLLDSRCLQMIKDRKEMWSFAAQVESRGLYDIMVQVNQSSMRTYLFSMIGLMIFALILLGICCGRITKRVPVDLKNK